MSEYLKVLTVKSCRQIMPADRISCSMNFDFKNTVTYSIAICNKCLIVNEREYVAVNEVNRNVNIQFL